MHTATIHQHKHDVLEQKREHKARFQEEVGWVEEPRTAVLCIPTGVSDKLGGAILQELLPGLLTLPVQIAILGKGSATYGQWLTEMSKENPERIAIVGSDEESQHAMFGGADMALFLTDASEMAELENALKSGAVPIAPACTYLENYNPNQESGNSFTYDTADVWHVFAALVRALETFKFPYDWKTIQLHGVETVG